jgi:hypothetical protein
VAENGDSENRRKALDAARGSPYLGLNRPN